MSEIWDVKLQGPNLDPEGQPKSKAAPSKLPTPRTDAASVMGYSSTFSPHTDLIVTAKFSRQLESELAEAQRERDSLQKLVTVENARAAEASKLLEYEHTERMKMEHYAQDSLRRCDLIAAETIELCAEEANRNGYTLCADKIRALSPAAIQAEAEEIIKSIDPRLNGIVLPADGRIQVSARALGIMQAELDRLREDVNGTIDHCIAAVKALKVTPSPYRGHPEDYRQGYENGANGMLEEVLCVLESLKDSK